MLLSVIQEAVSLPGLSYFVNPCLLPYMSQGSFGNVSAVRHGGDFFCFRFDKNLVASLTSASVYPAVPFENFSCFILAYFNHLSLFNAYILYAFITVIKH
jgi:hypothetical protein